jgi:hypothetical protein
MTAPRLAETFVTSIIVVKAQPFKYKECLPGSGAMGTLHMRPNVI